MAGRDLDLVVHDTSKAGEGHKALRREPANWRQLLEPPAGHGELLRFWCKPRGHVPSGGTSGGAAIKVAPAQLVLNSERLELYRLSD